MDSTPFLRPGRFVDSDHPAVARFAAAHLSPGLGARETAVTLFYAVRDGFRYSPWGVKIVPEAFRASFVAQRDPRKGAHCIDKATLLAACARWAGIPSRLHFANVRNHIGTEELERQLGTDLLVFHGYAELFLEDRWVAATPAFNRELCERLGVDPLEFDGEHDAVFQQYDRTGGRFMEYVYDYGPFPDIPFDLMVGEWRKHYSAFRRRGMWPERGRDGERAGERSAESPS